MEPNTSDLEIQQKTSCCLNKSKKTFVFILLIIVLLCVAVLFYMNSKKIPKRIVYEDSSINLTSTKNLTQVPDLLAKLIDFSQVKPYEIQEVDYSNGIKQYSLKFNTGHFSENYTLITQSLVDDNKFILDQKYRDSNNFTLIFHKGKESLNVFAGPNEDKSDKREPSTIKTVLYVNP
jgi:hypothetical protein